MRKILMLIITVMLTIVLTSSVTPAFAGEYPPFGEKQNRDRWQMYELAPFQPQWGEPMAP